MRLAFKSCGLMVLGVLCTILIGCAHKVDTDAMSAAALLTAGEKAMHAKNYDQAEKFFEAIRTRFPFDPLTKRALLDSMYVDVKNEKPALALSAAETYIRLYPRDPHVDYAYYMKGMASFSKDVNWFQSIFRVDLTSRDLSHFKSAFRDFNTLVRLYPRSCYAAEARLRMAFIRNAIAEHTLQIAQFYFDRDAYVAAVNRAQTVVLHYQGAPQVEDALVLLVKAYDKLGMHQQAKQSQRLLDALQKKMKSGSLHT